MYVCVCICKHIKVPLSVWMHRKLSSDKQARDLSPKRACTSNPQEETGGEDVGGARGDRRHKKNASCVVESPKDDNIIMSEVELDKDTFQKVRRMVLSGRHLVYH